MVVNRRGGMAMEYRHLIVKRGLPAARVTLNRPEKRNALSLEVLRELDHALNDLGRDPETRVVVIDGAGPVFSAGHDLGEMVGREAAFYTELFDACSVLMRTIHAVPQPVIAKVHGVATAAGCQLVAACDLAYAADDARFATPGVKIGLFCSTPMVPLTRSIGRKRALEMLLTGQMVDAATAVDWGLINHAVPGDRLDAAVEELAATIGGFSPLTIGVGKAAFYTQVELDEDRAYDHTKGVMAMNMLADDAQEGISAFLEKRAPTWTGR
jgi:enoyl-CoA hydratase/carnithine racemase